MTDNEKMLPRKGEIIKGMKDQFKVVQLLGKGGFGAVFEVERRSDKLHVAMKCELVTVPAKTLHMDVRVLMEAVRLRNRHFCTLEDTGTVDGRFTFLCMKMIGRNMHDLRVSLPRRRFSVGTSLKMAIQSLRTLEELHKIGYLHRDIKPSNFAIGREDVNEQRLVHILDFGLARKYLDKNGAFMEKTGRERFVGTTRYASLAAHRELDQSRKDDLESWLYMVVEWTSGYLPWKHLTVDQIAETRRMKEELRGSPDSLSCFFARCPAREFRAIFHYLDGMFFSEIPKYHWISGLLLNIFPRGNMDFSDPLDWDVEDYEGTVMIGSKKV